MSGKEQKIDLYLRVKAFIEEKQWLHEKDAVLVAVSGGVDSVVLLHLLRQLAQEWRLQLFAGHVNHQLRGAEADEDEQFVRRLCRQWQIKLLVCKANVDQFRREHKMGLEEAARAVRYDVLNQWAERHHCRYIVLGHTADDQVETVLMQFLRGAGICGLSGIPVQRQNIIRPLLPFTRHEIETYARTHDLHWQHDRSNDDTSLTRNRIRHVLLPLLRRDYNPRIDANILRLAEFMLQAEGYLEYQAEQALYECTVMEDGRKIILEIDSFLSYFNILQKYMLRMAVRRLHGDERLVDGEGWQSFWQFIQAPRPKSPLRWHRGWEIWRWHNQIAIVHSSELDESHLIQKPPCRIELANGYLFEIKPCAVAFDSIVNNQDETIAYVDGDLLHFPMALRHWRPEERFRPLGMKYEKRVAAFLKDAQVPNYQRPETWIVESNRQIVWICGYRLDDRFKVTENTKLIFQMQLIKHATH